MSRKEAIVDAESNRMWASASFVGVLIVVGLPLWWKTTEVYRVALPYEKISTIHSLPHYITTELTVIANDEATAADIVGLIEQAFENSDTLRVKINKGVLSESLRHTLESVTDDMEAVEEVSMSLLVNRPNIMYLVQRKPLFQDAWLAGERVLFFKDARAATKVVEVLTQWVYEPAVLAGALSVHGDAARRTRCPLGPGHHAVLSVVPPPREQVVFPAREAVEDYIGTFVDELSEIYNFTLKSQWLHHVDFDFQAKEVKDASEYGRHFAVRRDRLHLLLTRLEERTATHVSELPTINLVLYVAPCERAPLVIYDDNDVRIPTPIQAFMSPKWGGVVIWSPTPGECSSGVIRPNVNWIMGAFLAQLRVLVGITEKAMIPGAQLEPLRAPPPRHWELDALRRLRTLEQLHEAQLTLQSLAQLLGQISNIVINDEVGSSIKSAVEEIHNATQLMARGAVTEAYRASREAYLAAEAAFVAPSLLALLYFPDDQKYAIYIPLFLPIMFPVVLSLKNLIQWLRGNHLHKLKKE